MNIFVWVLQVILALWGIVGGGYMATHYQSLASAWAYSSLPGYFWVLLGVVQILLSLGLVSSVIKSIPRRVVPISAICLAIIFLAGIALYAQYEGFPGALWGVIPAVLLLFVAYVRGKKPVLNNHTDAG